MGQIVKTDPEELGDLLLAIADPQIREAVAQAVLPSQGGDEVLDQGEVDTLESLIYKDGQYTGPERLSVARLIAFKRKFTTSGRPIDGLFAINTKLKRLQEETIGNVALRIYGTTRVRHSGIFSRAREGHAGRARVVIRAADDLSANAFSTNAIRDAADGFGSGVYNRPPDFVMSVDPRLLPANTAGAMSQEDFISALRLDRPDFRPNISNGGPGDYAAIGYNPNSGEATYFVFTSAMSVQAVGGNLAAKGFTNYVIVNRGGTVDSVDSSNRSARLQTPGSVAPAYLSVYFDPYEWEYSGVQVRSEILNLSGHPTEIVLATFPIDQLAVVNSQDPFEVDNFDRNVAASGLSPRDFTLHRLQQGGYAMVDAGLYLSRGAPNTPYGFLFVAPSRSEEGCAYAFPHHASDGTVMSTQGQYFKVDFTTMGNGGAVLVPWDGAAKFVRSRDFGYAKPQEGLKIPLVRVRNRWMPVSQLHTQYRIVFQSGPALVVDGTAEMDNNNAEHSARSALLFFNDGRAGFLLAHEIVNGKVTTNGPTLRQFSEIAADYGALHGVNMDGAGWSGANYVFGPSTSPQMGTVGPEHVNATSLLLAVRARPVTEKKKMRLTFPPTD